MVATRRGTRVGSPVKNISDETSEATVPTPSTRARHRIVMEENQSQSEITGDSQTDEKDDSVASSLPLSQRKRETRRSMRHLADKKQPESTHEADVSESESCCSVGSGVLATPRTRRRTVAREKPQISAKDDISEAESCSSAVSASRSRRAPRSTRKRVQTPAASDAAKTDDGDLSEAESCSSVISLTQVLDTRRITRSHRKIVVEEPNPSEPESCSSIVSGIRGSTVRRSARNQKGKPTEPIPLNLEETTVTPSSPLSKRLRDRGCKTSKSEVPEEIYDSEDCKSGPSLSPWRTRRHEAKRVTLVGESDSESVPTDIYTSQDSPSSLRGRETPCSSRTGSASSNRAFPVTRARSKSSTTSDVRVILTCVNAILKEDTEGEERKSLPLGSDGVVVLDPEEPMNSTMTMDPSEVQECTIIDETAADVTLVLDADESVESNLDAEVKTLETQSTEKLEKAVDEMAATVTEDREETRDVAMENNEAEFVKADHAAEDAVGTDSKASVPSVVEKNMTDPKEVVEREKGVVVTEDADEIDTASMDEECVFLNDAERPSSSSNTQEVSSMTEQPSKRFPRKEVISLLDSSEDEESADEGLSADEEEKEGSSHEAVDGINEEEMMCPDEGQSSVEAHSNRLFIIDTRPGVRPEEKYYADAKQIEEKEEDEDGFIDEEEDDDDEDSKLLFVPRKPLMQLSTSIDPGLKMKDLGGLYISFDASKPKGLSSGSKTLKKVDELLKKSVIVPDLEKKDAVPPYKESQHAAKLKRKAEKEKTTGDGWFNMKAPELTEELRNDLKALKMRSAIDPKHFYRKNDREGFPKYFQVGTVVDSPVDFYSSRIPKKQRKRTIVEELIADAEFRSNNKKRYQEIMTEKAAQAAGKKYKKNKFSKKKTNK